MERDMSEQREGAPRSAEIVDLLDTESRIRAYLLTTMLESGDDPKAVEAALENIETARARLKAKPVRVTAVPAGRVLKQLP